MLRYLIVANGCGHNGLSAHITKVAHARVAHAALADGVANCPLRLLWIAVLWTAVPWFTVVCLKEFKLETFHA
jgi:hypothetical protein